MTNKIIIKIKNLYKLSFSLKEKTNIFIKNFVIKICHKKQKSWLKIAKILLYKNINVSEKIL